RDYGSKVELYKGVDTWFKRIREYGEANGVKVEHYIISSGLKEMIEGTGIAGEFEKIYASSFYYNDKGSAVWPAQVVNFTNKTQFLFRIEKGILDINDNKVNNYFSPDELRVPFRNIVYIGDSETDVPCMKLVNVYGGHSIGVYDPEKQNKNKVHALMKQNRIKYFAPADYSEGSIMGELIEDIILKTSIYEKLENKHIGDLKEADGQE
ncbi:MAG: HAD family hydrolase, partial [Lachnospiraceae bacterium]|nr:HAD family hydrolase [Lachnospiraceae bacterium]